MDDSYLTVDMYFHPLMDINKEHILNEKLVKRNNIKVLTYNIFLRPPGVKNNDNDWKNERLMDFIQVINDYDVICLQEVFDFCNNRKHLFVKLASQAGFLYHSYCEPPSFFEKAVVDGGIMILSR